MTGKADTDVAADCPVEVPAWLMGLCALWVPRGICHVGCRGRCDRGKGWLTVIEHRAFSHRLNVGGDTDFSKVRKQGPNRPLVVPWDHKRRRVGLIGADSGVVTAQAGSSM